MGVDVALDAPGFAGSAGVGLVEQTLAERGPLDGDDRQLVTDAHRHAVRGRVARRPRGGEHALAVVAAG